jgi:predicted dehydrogenase
MDLPDVDRFRERDWSAPVGGTLDIALVGLGEFTTGWVVPSIADCRHVDLGAVVSGSPETAASVAETHDAVALSYEEFLDGDRVDAYDAIYILTPNATHERYASAAARQGKAVLCEKPLAATLDGGRRIVEACRDAGVVLQVAYRLQTDPIVRWARAAVRAGGIGEPIHASGTMAQDLFTAVNPDPEQWRLDPALSGGGALIDLGIYPLNTLGFLTDSQPTRMSASTWSTDDAFRAVDEHVAFIVTYDGGLRASCGASQQSARSDRLRLTGTAGTLVLEPAYFGEVTAHLTRDGNTIEHRLGATNEMREQLAYFASHVLRDEPPEPDGDVGLADMAAITAGYRSAAEGRPVDVEL